MNKRIVLLVLLTIICEAWTISKPMESVTNYNVLLLHGAYESGKGFSENVSLSDAYSARSSLENGATLGAYDNDDRLTVWLSKEIFEEPGWKEKYEYVHNSYVYNWRSFSDPANSSINNAVELGNRTWNRNKKFGGRRALVEEAQEVKAEYPYFSTDSNKYMNLHGQVALDSMRNHPDLYRQLASRYILVGHSMGGVVSREYVQGNFYNGDVDKIISIFFGRTGDEIYG